MNLWGGAPGAESYSGWGRMRAWRSAGVENRTSCCSANGRCTRHCADDSALLISITDRIPFVLPKFQFFFTFPKLLHSYEIEMLLTVRHNVLRR